MSIGRLGVWGFLDGLSAPQLADLVGQLEDWNYGAFWFAEALGREAMSQAAWLLANSKRITVATGIANIYARDAQSSAAARATLNEMSGGRFLLGLGVSHAPLVASMRGHNYSKPLAFMREYLEKMSQAPYSAVPPEKSGELILAALRPKMLELSASAADGAHPYNVTPEHTEKARKILGPDKRLYVEQKVLLETDPVKARAVARQTLEMYLTLPNYRNNWLEIGFSEADVDGASDRFLDAMVAWGDETAIRKRISEHWMAGADQVCIQALRSDGGPGPDLKLLELLAPSNEQPST